MNVRDETRHYIHVHKSAALRYALLCIVTRLISDVHFHITGLNINIQFWRESAFQIYRLTMHMFIYDIFFILEQKFVFWYFQ